MVTNFPINQKLFFWPIMNQNRLGKFMEKVRVGEDLNSPTIMEKFCPEHSFVSSIIFLILTNIIVCLRLYENRSLRNECSAWDVALETLLNNFLPLKFAYIGRLDLTDVIDSNFYITRVPIKPDKVLQGEFPNLKDLNHCGAAPCKLVYVVRFENSKKSSISLENVQEKGSINDI